MNAVPALLEKRQYQFDQFRIDPVRRLLLRDGEVVPITPKPFAILLLLLERRGQVVDKKLLIEQVWCDACVTEANLAQNISSLRKALGERAGDCRYIVTLPGQGYSFVAEVVETGMEAPGVTPAPTPPSEESQALPPEPGASGTQRFRRRAAGMGIAAMVLLAASALVLLDTPRSETELRPQPPAASAAAVRRPSIAVLGFYNLSGSEETSWLAPALAELLTTELGAGGQVRVISGESVARARGELSLPAAGSLDGPSLRRLHSLLDAERLVFGSYVSVPGVEGRRVRLDLRVVELPSGETATSLTETGTEAELFELVSRTGKNLRQALGLAVPSREQARAVRALHPATPEAASLYARGLARLRSFDYPGARGLLLQAAQADPASAPIHTALSRVWYELGDDAKSMQEARKALELAGPLSREGRLVIEARLAEASHQWSKASEIYRSLWTFFPDDLEYGLLLATALYEAGRSSEALAAIQVLRRSPPPAGDDPRFDLAEARAAGRLADSALARQSLARAEAKGRRSGEPLIVAEALMLQGGLSLLEGDPRTASERFRQARGIYERTGHRWGAAQALAGSGLTLHRLGELGEAGKAYREALALSQHTGSDSGIAAQDSNLGRLYLDRGELDRALGHLEKARVYLAETQDSLQEARLLNLIGSIFAIRGDLDAAAERYERAVTLSRRMGIRHEQARFLASLASVLAWKGQLGEARRSAEGSLQLLRDLHRPGISAVALRTSADVLARLGDLALARQRYDKAIELQRQVGDPIGLGRMVGARGRLALREGDLPLARRLGAEQIRLGRETGARALEAEALRLLGNIHLAAGELDQGRDSFATALEVGREMGETLEVAAVRLDLARLDLAAGKGAEAARVAQRVAAWAAPRGVGCIEGEALAVVTEALLRQGDIAGARAASGRVQAIAERTEDRELRVALAPVVARAEAAGGDVSGALGSLRRTVTEATRLGFVAAALDGRFTLAELELPGDPAGARVALEGVRRDAETRGLLRLAAAAVAARERVLKNVGQRTL
jgi:DNA-binding winged helix-turn-helix (wHTH) protein/tetratricopeptide (TPR) repeat protein